MHSRLAVLTGAAAFAVALGIGSWSATPPAKPENALRTVATAHSTGGATPVVRPFSDAGPAGVH
ncbi:hypothetical protein ACFV3R_27730 [Streptomyces sp. NPDC059740]|uniref:hypothetical protein n=1 Tax=Streptomyces sp. NPDC059740 TaxID=3346926 RepID=UPI003665F6C0